MTRSQQNESRNLFLTALGALALACSPTPPAAQSSDDLERESPPSPSPRPTVAVSWETLSPSGSPASFAAAPPGCPGPEPLPQSVADFVGPVVFGPPLWAGLYATHDPATNAYSAPDAPLTEHGWRIKILFLLEPDQDSTVDLVGAGVKAHDGSVRFAVEGIDPGVVARFDPDEPAIPVQHQGWREYPTYAYFPAAGCYRLTARWSGGSSELGFGIGG